MSAGAILTLALALGIQAAAAPPPCRYDDALAALTDYDQWGLTLVDTAFRLPDGYRPPDLVSVRQAGLDDDRLLRSLVVPALRELLEAARAEGLGLELQSAYRSYEYQEEVFAGWVASLGMEAALRISARPGHSEHQLGTAIDLRSAGGPPPWDQDDWASTPEGAWLRDNAWRFGFVMSYPEGGEGASCYAYEPWHYRYVGRDAAAEIRSRGLTLREWLWEQLP